jgi:molybdate transport system substrate-binding protein
MRRTLLLLTLAAAALAAPAAAHADLNVYAASSLRSAFPDISGTPAYNFGASNTLQTQIQRGAPADVFASADPSEAQTLFKADLCSRPVTFATNILVMIVPRSNPGNIKDVNSLKAGGKLLAIGAPGVPIGDYTRLLLSRLRLSSVLSSNTVSQEKDVASVSAKVALGSADAGFVYHTDARSARGRVREIALPGDAGAPVVYQLCAVRRDGADRDGARDFIDHVTGADGRRALAAAGFGLPPRG